MDSKAFIDITYYMLIILGVLKFVNNDVNKIDIKMIISNTIVYFVALAFNDKGIK
jgi:hypothetical protein